VGGQVVIQVVMRRGAVAGGTFYCAKKWGGNCSPCPPFTDAPAVTYTKCLNDLPYPIGDF